MYSSVLGTDAGQILTRIAPATVLGNCVAIIFGGLANNIGERKPSLTGNGCLVNDGHEVKKQPPMKPTFALLCTGLIISMAFYELGALCHHFISIVPTYAWMIVAVVIVKGTGILSERLEDAAREWGQFAIHSWTAAALTGIGATLIDLKTILHTITPFYLLSVVLIGRGDHTDRRIDRASRWDFIRWNHRSQRGCVRRTWAVPEMWRCSAVRNGWNCFHLHRL